MQLYEIIVSSLKHVIVRPTKIIKDLDIDNVIIRPTKIIKDLNILSRSDDP